MSGLGLLSDYNNDSELSESDDKTEDVKEPFKQSESSSTITEKLRELSNDSGRSDKSDNKDKETDDNNEHSKGKVDYDDKSSDKHRDFKRDDKSRDDKSRDDKSRDDKSRDERSRDERSRDDRSRDDRSRDDRSRDDRSRGDKRRSYENKRDDRRYRDNDRSRDFKRRDYRGRDNRDVNRNRSRHDDKDREYGDFRSKQDEKEREYEEYRRRKYGDSRDWGKVSAESLKDIKTDATLPLTFDSTIAKQLAAQREKRKLLWGKKEGEGSAQKSVWGSDSIRNDETGEQTAKFLKLMGVKDVTAENVKDYKRTDESVLRSSKAVDSMEGEYEKSRYMQHINKGVGLGLVQFNKPSAPP